MTIVSIQHSKRSRKIVTCLCDTCGIEFIHKQPSKATLRVHHFHDAICYRKSMSNGVVRTARETTCLNRYGSINPFSTEIGKQHTKETLLKTRGVTSPMQDKQIQAAAKATTQKRYGVQFMIEHSTIRQRVKSQEAKAKRKQTNIQRYGIEYGYQLGKHSWTSKIEDRLYEFLCECFGANGVERQATVKYVDKNGKNRWWFIDFFIPSSKTYIQLDGIYWHGLNRPIETIRNSTSEQCKNIAKCWDNDRFQDRWFSNQKLCLIRVTETQAHKLLKA